jgi:hypothetical protein
MIQSGELVVSNDEFHKQLSSYTEAQIKYHLHLMKEKEWIHMYSDGSRMTWEGHDYFDDNFVDNSAEVSNTPAADVKLNVVD